MTWSAAQYTLFEDDRTRPVQDLLAAIPVHEVRRAVDIGCGPGNSTELLRAKYSGAEVQGFDSSEAMIAAARQRLPNVRFDIADVQTWEDPGPFDVLLSNAVLHWLPDHAALFPRLAARLSPGGSLAIQMPDNLDEPAHALMRRVAADGPWGETFAALGDLRTPMGSVDWYYRLLRPLCTRVDVWRTTYTHVLAGSDAVVEWFKGSGLRPFLAALNEAQQALYLERYRDAISVAYPAQPNGEVLLPFPRLFMVATR